MASSPSPEDINLLSFFLSNSEITSLTSHRSATHLPLDCIVICASSVLQPATELFKALVSNPELTRILVLCGGIGHSTTLVYEAVARHPVYHSIARDVVGLPEAAVLRMILETFFDIDVIKSAGCEILVEDQSTNCGANAFESRRVLESHGHSNDLKTIVLMQDPTMAIRTKAAFTKLYDDIEHYTAVPSVTSAPAARVCSFNPTIRSDITCFPGLVPIVKMGDHGLEFDVEAMGRGVTKEDLWDMQRFLDLLVGEIPRLKLYGPEGKGDIAHVDVPKVVEEAWTRISALVKSSRAKEVKKDS